MSGEQVDLQQSAKDFVLSELEKNGVISYMRAKLKKSVINVIDSQKESFKQKIDFDYMTPLHRLNKSKEIVIICHLIKEFLSFYELEYTFPIFENESNIKETIQRESLLKELKLQDKGEEKKPVLLSLLEEYQSKWKKVDLGISKDTYGALYSNLEATRPGEEVMKAKSADVALANPIIPKKQLAPINFMDKSVEINPAGIAREMSKGDENILNDKFNTFILGDVYRRNEEVKIDTTISNNDSSKENPSTEAKPEVEKPKEKEEKAKSEEIIPEEILISPKGKAEENEESKKSISNLSNNSLGFDQSISNYNLNEYDYYEEAEKPQ